MIRIETVLCSTILFLWSPACFAHGVRHTVFEGASGIEVHYDDDTPMRYSEVSVFSPLDDETEFQQAFTDKNGRFTFVPDATGTWRLVVDDGMGHAISKNIEINEWLKLASMSPPAQLTRFQGIIIGLSVIFGLFGMSSLFMAWQRSQKQRQ